MYKPKSTKYWTWRRSDQNIWQASDWWCHHHQTWHQCNKVFPICGWMSATSMAGSLVRGCGYYGPHMVIVTSWLHGTLASWHNGTMAPWHHDTMASWHHVIIASWHHGTMAQWHHGTMVPCLSRIMLKILQYLTTLEEKHPIGRFLLALVVIWIFGFMYFTFWPFWPWVKIVCKWYHGTMVPWHHAWVG